MVGRESLLAEKPFEGFSPHDAYDYESLILRHQRFAPRIQAEEDPSLKQPIAYCVLVDRRSASIFAYQRATRSGEYWEERLRGKWSIGLGGHIDLCDIRSPNPIRASMEREIREEVACDGVIKPEIVGYINDERDMVGRVHFGILYCVDIGSRKVRHRTKEIAHSKMVSRDEWLRMLAEGLVTIEGWSRIITPPIIDLLSKEGSAH